MAIHNRTNAAGERLFCIWGSGGPPPLDDPSIWHTEAEFLEQAAKMTALSSPLRVIDLKMVGTIWARHNQAPQGRKFNDYRDK